VRRYVVERAFANFKAWRIMRTDYRRPLDTFPRAISAVIGPHFYKINAESASWNCVMQVRSRQPIAPGKQAGYRDPSGLDTGRTLAVTAPRT